MRGTDVYSKYYTSGGGLQECSGAARRDSKRRMTSSRKKLDASLLVSKRAYLAEVEEGALANSRAPRDVDVHVGNRVRVGRHARKFSQQELAGRLGITFQQVQKYESGSNRISAGRLHQIAVVMGLPVTFFFEGVIAGGRVDPAMKRVNAFLSTPEGVDIVNAFPRLEKRSQRAIVDLIIAHAR